MSAALDFRKCKRLLLSSLAISPGTGVHVAKQRHGFCRAKSPHSKHKKDKSNRVQLVFFWWRCGDLNPGSSFYTRHLLHAYSVIKFSYRRSPTDGGFEEAENADLLTAVGKSVARSV